MLAGRSIMPPTSKCVNVCKLVHQPARLSLPLHGEIRSHRGSPLCPDVFFSEIGEKDGNGFLDCRQRLWRAGNRLAASAEGKTFDHHPADKTASPDLQTLAGVLTSTAQAV